MAKLKLIKALSYTGVVSATVQNPFVIVDDEATVELAVASGYFEVVSEAPVISVPVDEVPTESDDDDGLPGEIEDDGVDEVPTESDDDGLQYGGKLLNGMNKSELETFAAYRNVDIKGAKTKADIIEMLRAALPAAELEGKIYYGSPTMVELQEQK